MNLSLKLMAVVALLAGLQASPLHADALDQVLDTPGGFASNGGGVTAQTFTVGRSGTLTGVEVPLRLSLDNRLPPLSLELRLLRVNNGVPGKQPTDVLAFSTVVIPGPQFETYPDSVISPPDFQWIPLEEINLSVEVGDQFAIAVGPLNSPATSYQRDSAFDWVATFAPSNYTGGAAWALDGISPQFYAYGVGVRDFNFRTYVVPEPTSAFLMLVSIALLRRVQSASS